MKVLVKSIVAFLFFGGMTHVLFVSYRGFIPQHLEEWVAVSLAALLFFTIVWIKESESRSDGD